MAKKMYDILPPEVVKKLENTIKELEAGKKKKKTVKHIKSRPDSHAPLQTGISAKADNSRVSTKVPAGHSKASPARRNKERRFPLKEILVGGGIIVFLLGAVAIRKLPKADIEIFPNIETATLSEKVTLSASAKIVDFSGKIIPARYVEAVQDGSQNFPATGMASNNGKASGTIKVYNKMETSLTLVKGTHFLSDSGKYFVTLLKIVVPAGKKNAPGSINVQIEAKEYGPEYNIGPSKFSVPKLSGTVYYYSTYGESNSSMTGGYTGNVKKVTDSDIQEAKTLLTQKLLAGIKNSLKDKVAKDEILLESAVVSVILDSSADIKPNAIADSFNASAKVKSFVLVFKKEDVEIFVENDILAVIPKDDSFIKESLNTSYVPGVIDVKSGKLVVDLQSSVKAHADINTGDLVDLFPRKSSDQIKQIIDQMYQGKISELKIKFWPFWVSKAPNDKTRITVRLNLE